MVIVAGVPKQFPAPRGNESVFQRAAQLAAVKIELGAPLIVGNEEHRFLALEQLRGSQIHLAAVLTVLDNFARRADMTAYLALIGGSAKCVC